jgi:hypothetical protein
MRIFFIVFLLLNNFVFPDETKIEEDTTRVLGRFQKFKVVTLLPFFERIDQKVIYETMTESFKKYGQVIVSEKKSMFQSLLQLDAQDPVCFFVIDKEEEQIKGSLEILAEVEVVANKYKTTCSIWKKTLYVPIPPEKKNQVESIIANLIQEMIDEVSKDWMKANADAKQPIFHINKFQDL